MKLQKRGSMFEGEMADETKIRVARRADRAEMIALYADGSQRCMARAKIFGNSGALGKASQAMADIAKCLVNGTLELKKELLYAERDKLIAKMGIMAPQAKKVWTPKGFKKTKSVSKCSDVARKKIVGKQPAGEKSASTPSTTSMKLMKCKKN